MKFKFTGTSIQTYTYQNPGGELIYSFLKASALYYMLIDWTLELPTSRINDPLKT